MNELFLNILRCPKTFSDLSETRNALVNKDSSFSYKISPSQIVLFLEQGCSDDGKIQSVHYDKVSEQYIKNLNYPHTIEYVKFLDDLFYGIAELNAANYALEVCCGRAEVLERIKGRVKVGAGADVSIEMLNSARKRNPEGNILFVHADATMLPFKDNSFDAVLTIGGIHHVRDTRKLFSEISRVLKNGGSLYFREPVNDFFLWKQIRKIIYKLSPGLDYDTEQPLEYEKIKSDAESAGLSVNIWRHCAFIGFCFLMNSDILIFNRFFRFIPGISYITKIIANIDDILVRVPFLNKAGLLVIGELKKPN